MKTLFFMASLISVAAFATPNFTWHDMKKGDLVVLKASKFAALVDDSTVGPSKIPIAKNSVGTVIDSTHYYRKIQFQPCPDKIRNTTGPAYLINSDGSPTTTLAGRDSKQSTIRYLSECVLEYKLNRMDLLETTIFEPPSKSTKAKQSNDLPTLGTISTKKAAQ